MAAPTELTEQQLQDITRDALLDLMVKIEATDHAEMFAGVVARASIAAFYQYTMHRFGRKPTADLLRAFLTHVERDNLASMTPKGSA